MPDPLPRFGRFLRSGRGALCGALALFSTVGSARAADWDVWRIDDAERILECAAVLSLLEEAPGGAPWPLDLELDSTGPPMG